MVGKRYKDIETAVLKHGNAEKNFYVQSFLENTTMTTLNMAITFMKIWYFNLKIVLMY